MRHRKRRTKLSMMTAHREAMLRNMVKSLFRHQRIETTLRRAKEARRFAERIITLGKTDNLVSRRRAYSFLTDHDLVRKLFTDIVPLFKAKTSGFTRIIPLGFRRGDGAAMAILELTEKKMVEKKPKKKQKAMAGRKRGEEASEEGEKAVSPAPEAERKEARKEEPKTALHPKTKTTRVEEKKAERAKSEERKITEKKSFMKDLRGFFRRKTDM